MLQIKLLEKNIEERMQGDLSEGNIGGAAVAVTEGGQVIYKKCFGYESLTENKPICENSLFRLASMTKPITTACALSLVDEGRLSLSDDIAKYLPECASLPLRTPNGDGTFTDGGVISGITVEQLFCHSSGIVSGGMFDQMTKKDRESRESAFSYYIKNGVAFVPGTMQEYNASASFDMAIMIMERITDEPYESFLKRRILDPCGMKDTFYVRTDAQATRLVAMMDKKDGKAIHSVADEKGEAVDYARSVHWGGAGLSSTLDDYLRFAEMLRGRGAIDNTRVLSEDAIKNMSSVHFSPWGLGVRVIEQSYGTLNPGAFGWSGAYGTHFWVDPVADITAVYMKNSRYDGGAGALTAYQFEQDVYRAWEE